MHVAFLIPIPRRFPMAPRSKRSRSVARSAVESRSASAPAKRHKAAEGVAAQVLTAEKRMSEELSKLSFSSPVTHVYDPIEYAWNAHEWFVKRYGNTAKDVLMIGMNPGPFGMAQTGVPFGEVAAVKDFILMPSDIEIGKPPKENKARPINGLSCHRSEVSGRRLWLEWAREDYETADKFFETFFVHNYCPLLFLEASGKNRTPVQLKAAEREAVIKICDDGLRSVVKALKPKAICGIGGFAVKRCQQALKNEIEEEGLIIGTVLHPSPASPAANRGWVEKARIQIGEILEQVAAGEANVNGK